MGAQQCCESWAINPQAEGEKKRVILGFGDRSVGLTSLSSKFSCFILKHSGETCVCLPQVGESLKYQGE